MAHQPPTLPWQYAIHAVHGTVGETAGIFTAPTIIDDTFCQISQTTTNFFLAPGPPPVPLGYDVIIGYIDALFQTIRLYHTPLHTELFRFILNKALNLVRGKYINQSGTHGATLVGTRGLGKSFMLRVMTVALPHFLPRLVTLYVKVDAISTNISTLINNQLNVLNVPALSDYPEGRLMLGRGYNPVFLLCKRLEFAHLRVMMFVDELQTLYEKNGVTHPVAVEILEEISLLGNQTSGQVCVLLCGSSAFLGGLIGRSVNMQDPLYQHYQLLFTGAPNLNRHKFQIHRIIPDLPTDLNSVAIMMNIPEADRNLDVNLQYIRQLAFFAGSNARQVEREVLEEHGEPLTPTGAVPYVDSVITVVRDMLQHMMWKKNAKLFDALTMPHDPANTTATDAEFLANVRTTNWAVQFQPLTEEEVANKIRRKRAKRILKEQDCDRMEDIFLHLADLGVLIIHGAAIGSSRVFYPSALFDLLYTRPGKRFQPNFMMVAEELLRAGPVQAAQLVGNPRVIAAVAAAGLVGSGCAVS